MSEADLGVLAHGFENGDDGRRHSVWIRTIPDPDAEGDGLSTASEARWRYPDLDELLARPRERRPAFHEALDNPNPIVATNAAIAMARLADSSGMEQLYRAAETPTLPLPMRCAAIEALGSLPDDESPRLLGELLDQYGQSTGADGRRVYVPELHAEVITALGRHVSPVNDPRFLAALHSSSSDVRLEAVRAWANDQTVPLPDALIDLRAAGDVNVRIAVVEAIAARRHPEAHRLLGEAVRDHDLRVKLAAVSGLGELADSDARAILEDFLAHHAPRIREAAVAALARSDAFDVAVKAAGDESWRVRAEVARALAHYQEPEAETVARTLLDDPSTEVHRELLEAIGRWPVQRSGPILLSAMGKESFLCRQNAASLLAAQWPPAASFLPEAPVERRQPELRRLAEAFREQFGLDNEAPAEQTSEHREHLPDQGELHHIAELLAGEDIDGLIAFGPRTVELLEVLALQRQRPIPEAVYRRALPELHRAFALLARLQADDTFERRRAASELASLARDEPLGELAVERLCQLVTPESDSLVFQSALSAVENDGSDAAQRLAYAAVGHAAAEVRRRGCLHLAAHPDPSHTPVLLPAIEDENAAVAAAAVQALGACGQLSDAGALTELMRSGNESLQLEAAMALVQLDHSRGVDALERLAYSRDPTVRRRVAEKMGELGDPIFTSTLIRLLDDRVSVMRAALHALPQTAGEDKAVTSDGEPLTTTERVRRWKAWFASQ